VACPRRVEWIEVTMISRGIEISIAGGANYSDRFFFSFFLVFFFSFSFFYHMFIVSTVQEMTCIFNDMAKTKPKRSN